MAEILNRIRRVVRTVSSGHAGRAVQLRWYRFFGKRLNYVRGWHTTRPMLVIESDDWGAEHIRSAEALWEILGREARFSDESSFSDGLERPGDVDRLCDVLSSFRDSEGRNAVLTANFVMANPDFKAVKESGFRDFRYRPIQSGFNHEEEPDGLWKAYRAAIENDVMVPQFHGLLHFSPAEWLSRLQRGDSATLKAFELEMIGEGPDSIGIGLTSMAPIYHGSEEAIEEQVRAGTELFRRTFGMESITTIAPCYGWRSPETENALLRHGVRAMQGRPYQYLPDGRMRMHYTGQHGYGGMVYMVRNCLLEQINGTSTIAQCKSEIAEAFAHRVPAIVCSHRMNYTSRVSTKTRDNGLKSLEEVLQFVLSKYPDAEFAGSDALSMALFTE